MKKTVIIGASEGIGKSLAFMFAKKNESLILVARNLEKLNQIKQEIKKNYLVNVDVYQCDISDLSALSACANFLNSFKLNRLILNAGICKLGLFKNLPEETILAHLNINIVAHTILTHKLLPNLDKESEIFAIASLAGFFNAINGIMYFSTKKYYLNFFKTLAYEMKNELTIKVFCPGFVKTNMIKNNINGNIPFFSMHSPDEIASYIANTNKKSRTIHIIGFRNQLMTHFSKLIPDVLMMKLIGFFSQKKQNSHLD